MNDPRSEPDLSALRRSPVPPGLAGRLAASLPTAAAPARALPPLPARAAAIAGVVAAVVLILGFSTGGKGWRALDAPQRAGLVAVLAAGAAWLAWEIGTRMTPAPRLRWPASLPVAMVAAGWAAWIAAIPDLREAPLVYLTCVVFTMLGAAATVLLVWLWCRRGFVPSQSGLVLAAMGVLGGLGAIQIFCPLIDLHHILASHAVPALLAGTLTAFWVRSSRRAR